MSAWEKQYDELNDIPAGMDDFYKHKTIQYSPPEAQAEIARLQAEVERLKAETYDASKARDLAIEWRDYDKARLASARNDALEDVARELMLRRSLLSKQNVALDISKELGIYDLCIEAIRALKDAKP